MIVAKCRKIVSPLLLLPLLLFPGTASAEFDEETLAEARAASCPELADAYSTLRSDERIVEEAIKNNSTENIATNIAGVASMALFDFGFFSWGGADDAKENLAVIREDIALVEKVAAEKSCDLNNAQAAQAHNADPQSTNAAKGTDGGAK
ncbi:MAG: hypothetical protein HQK87_05665 [Nitrospinae bacterium]|nr:hypothetical protein [Nitrospinota bacterium]